MAEQTGSIVDIGDWALREATMQAGAWQRQLAADEPFTIAVNISSRQLRDQQIVIAVREALSSAKLRPASLVLEITESLFMDQLGSAEVLHSLAAEGVSLSIDDFGTGYSSLSRLASLPVGQLKIDKSFVSGPDPRCSRIVPAIILMAHSVGLSVVAEGVEEVAQFEALHRSCCDLIQGYLLGRPIGASDFTDLVLADRGAMAVPAIALEGLGLGPSHK